MDKNVKSGTGNSMSNTALKALSVLITLATVVGLIATVINLIISVKSGIWRSAEVEATSLAAHVCVIFYGLYGYKIPKGNHLKYAYLVFSLCLVLIATETRTEEFSPIWLFIIGISIIPSSYVAGRLDRLSQNKVIIAAEGVLLLSASIIEVSRISAVAAEGILPNAKGFTELAVLISAFDPFIVWAALGKAYVKRYRAHRAASVDVPQ